MRTYEFLIFVKNPLVFPLLLPLGGSYVRLISVPFSLLFFDQFLVDFWSILGSILESFWGPFGSPNRPFLASIF